jgi:putative ATP-dependent endonuclease of OLD family
MYLRELQIEGYLAIRSGWLQLDTASVLVGENDSGLATLVDALELALGEASDGRARRTESRERAEARIRLTFEEREPGCWSEPCHAPLHASLPRTRGTPRRLELNVEVGRGARTLERRVRIEGAQGAPDERALAEHVRAMTPLVRVHGGTLTRTRAADTRRALDVLNAAQTDEALAKLVERVLFAAADVLSGAAADVEQAVADGARAARELLGSLPQHAAPARAGLGLSVLEILGEDSRAKASPGRDPDDGGPLAKQLGALLALAAILRRLPSGLPPGAEPLLVLEQPEAELHPMTLASSAATFERLTWQKIVTTHSSELLAALPIAAVQRVVRHDGVVRAFGLGPRALSRADLRRLTYHLRVHRGVAMFARVWLLVEGESEFWILPQLARVLGYDFAREGVCCVTFAQSGLEPLLRTARAFAIDWHLLADGDEAGQDYADKARDLAGDRGVGERVTLLRERDIEHCFWHHGHAATILRAAGIDARARGVTPKRAIARAVEKRSKPGLALGLVDAAARRGSAGVPPPLARLIETCVALARAAPERALAAPDPPMRRSRARGR